MIKIAVLASAFASAQATSISSSYAGPYIQEYEANAIDVVEWIYEPVWAEDSHEVATDLCERIFYTEYDGSDTLCCTPSDREALTDGCQLVWDAYAVAGKTLDDSGMPTSADASDDCSCSGIDSTIVGKWTIEYESSDSSYNLADPLIVEAEYDDTTPPEIGLPSDCSNGDYTYDVEKCTYFDVPELEAFDEVSLDIGDADYTIMFGSSVSSSSSSVTGWSSSGGVALSDGIDVNDPGTYTITYEAFDNGGLAYNYEGAGTVNVADEVTLVVVVSDTIAPDMSFENQEDTIECGEESDIPDAGASCTNLPCTDAPETTSYYALDSDFSVCEDSTTWDIGYGTCDTYLEGNENHYYCTIDGATAEGACPSACGSCVEEASCEDSDTFNAGYGDCDSYAADYTSAYGETGVNYNYCSVDEDDDGVLASIACPEACDTCDTDYAAYEAAILDSETTFVDLEAVGTYYVSHTCNDGYHTTTGVQTVVIEDTTPPSITCPDDVELWYDITFYEDYTHEAASDDCGDDAVITDDAADVVDQDTIGTYSITFTATDDVGLTATCTQEVVLIDTTEPECNFASDCAFGSEVAIEACTGTYEEYSVVCEDDYDADIQSKITSSGDVDIDVWEIGTFYIEYDACDQSDNCAPTLTRTIIISDNTDPVIQIVGDETYILEASGDSDLVSGAGVKCTDTCTALTNIAAKGWVHGPQDADLAQFVHVDIEALTYDYFTGLASPDVSFVDDQQYYCGESIDAMTATAASVESSMSANGAKREEITMDLAGLQETCGVYQISYTCTDWVGNTAAATQWIATVDTINPEIYTGEAADDAMESSVFFLAQGSVGVIAGSAAVFVGAVGLVAVATVMAAQRSRRVDYVPV